MNKNLLSNKYDVKSFLFCLFNLARKETASQLSHFINRFCLEKYSEKPQLSLTEDFLVQGPIWSYSALVYLFVCMFVCFIFLFLSQESDGWTVIWTNPHPLRNCPFFSFSVVSLTSYH